MNWVQKLAEIKCRGIEIESGVYSGCDTREGTLKDCPTCAGTGAEFPMLRLKCECDSKASYSIGGACQGQGWMLIPKAEQMGVLVGICADKPIIKLFKALNEDKWIASLLRRCHGDTPEEALAHAIFNAKT